MRTEAAFTIPGVPMPAYINIQRDLEGNYLVSVRSQGENLPSQIVIPEDEWHQLIADVGLIRAPKTDIDGNLDRLPEPEIIPPALHPSDAIVVENPEEAAAALDDTVPYDGPQGDPWPGVKG